MPAPRKPTVIHHLTGAMQAHPARFTDRTNEPQPEPGIGDAPGWIDDTAKSIWLELQRDIAYGVLTRQDRQTFAVLCCLLAQFRSQPCDMPTSRIAQMNSLFGQFGMTPSTRSKVSAASAVKPENPFAKHVRRN